MGEETTATVYDGTSKPKERALRDIQSPDGSPVPRAWTSAMIHLQAAQVERDCLRNPGATSQMRDEAAGRFGRELEKLFDQMSLLREVGATGTITNFLCKRGR